MGGSSALKDWAIKVFRCTRQFERVVGARLTLTYALDILHESSL